MGPGAEGPTQARLPGGPSLPWLIFPSVSSGLGIEGESGWRRLVQMVPWEDRNANTACVFERKYEISTGQEGNQREESQVWEIKGCFTKVGA